MRMALGALAGAACLGLASAPAMGGAHTWDINEIFSNADGTIQFIELKCTAAAAEINLNGLRVTSTATGNFFAFPGNLIGPTTNRSLLLATAGFAALPGAPTPDHIIVNNFFSTAGDTITYHIYDCATFTLLPPPCPLGSTPSSTPGALSTDGCLSLSRVGTGLISSTNSPKNYAGVSGTVFANPANTNGDGAVNVLDLIDLLLCFGLPAAGGCEAEDIDGSGTVNVLDLIALLLEFGSSCP